jgi:azurin
VIQNAIMKNSKPPRYTLYAEGLHEILGLASKDGYLYCAQRGEFTRLIDSDNDGEADIFEPVVSFPLTGHYHEFSFGPKVDKNGDFIFTANVSFDPVDIFVARSIRPLRGFMFKVTKEGKLEMISAGHRSPAGIFVNPETNDYFYTENQGDWVGSGGITHVEKGDFVGNPASLVWSNLPGNPVKMSFSEFLAAYGIRDYTIPSEGKKMGDYGIPIVDAAKRIKGLKPQAVTLPHSVMGQSTSDMVYLEPGNNFAPHFAGQMLVGDQAQSKVMRVSMEKVKGVYQGAGFPFLDGYTSGVMRFAFGSDGSLLVGMTNRGWGSTGKDIFGLQQTIWNGRLPFEMKNIKAMPDGFEIEFTKPINKEKAKDTESYKVTGFTYKYHHYYGSPIINDKNCPVDAAIISEDGMKVRIVVDSLREGYVHEVKLTNIISGDNAALLHNAGYYTLNKIPDGEKLIVIKTPKKEAKPEAKTAVPATTTKKPVAVVAKPIVLEKGGKNSNTMPTSWGGNSDKSLVISTKPGLMYDQTRIILKAGLKVKLTFNNNDDMLHNVVFVKPGTADAIGETATNMGLEGPKMNYVPKSDDVLFHTKLVTPGLAETIFFTAPKAPGKYTIVCTYPGHYASMQITVEIQ